MSRSTKQAGPHGHGQPADLDHDFLFSFLELDPETMAALMSLEPAPQPARADVPERPVDLLRSVEAVADDDVVALTGLYAQIESWSPPAAPPGKSRGRRRISRTRRQKSAKVSVIEPSPGPEVPSVALVDIRASGAAAVETAGVPALQAAPRAPLPRSRRARKGALELARRAAQAQEGYNTWLATRQKYALQWDYMNFDFSPPPPGPRTIREARRLERRTMMKYYRIDARKAHAREDKREARMLLARARRSGLQSA